MSGSVCMPCFACAARPRTLSTTIASAATIPSSSEVRRRFSPRKRVGDEARAQSLERFRKRPDRLPLQQGECQALEHQHAGQRDDERRDAEVRHPHALRGADERAHRQADERGRHVVPAPAHHQHGRQRTDESADRTHRQVDMSGDDHQQHAQRHDDDVAVLQHQVGQVQRLHQGAVGHDLEEHHDRDQRQQQPVLAQVATQPPGFRGGVMLRFWRRVRRGGGFGLHGVPIRQLS